MNHKLIVTIKF